jgi:hypothetical protein
MGKEYPQARLYLLKIKKISIKNRITNFHRGILRIYRSEDRICSALHNGTIVQKESVGTLQTRPTSSTTSLFFGHLLKGHEDKQEEKGREERTTGKGMKNY